MSIHPLYTSTVARHVNQYVLLRLLLLVHWSSLFFSRIHSSGVAARCRRRRRFSFPCRLSAPSPRPTAVVVDIIAADLSPSSSLRLAPSHTRLANSNICQMSSDGQYQGPANNSHPYKSFDLLRLPTSPHQTLVHKSANIAVKTDFCTAAFIRNKVYTYCIINLIIRPHRLHAVHRCSLWLQMSHVAWSVCLCLYVCVLVTRVVCEKNG